MRKGFTLLELSIVLVIIGLIIGGITVGADLIRAAELNSVVSDVNKYKVALHTFKLKYNALPGDMNNASSYWPTDCIDGGGTFCDGNGNGTFSDANNNNGYREGSRAWQHLGLAEILSGSYDGRYLSATVGGTYPESSISAMAYQFLRIGTPSSCTGSAQHSLYSITNRDVMILGSLSGLCLIEGGIAPPEAEQVDRKIDDGLADQGSVFGVNGSGQTGCAGNWANGVTSASYDLSSESETCRLVFFID